MSKLAEIIENKRREVEARLVGPLPMSMERREIRPFRQALLSVRAPALIAEVKKASPSQGLIREDFDPVEIARTYEEAGAHALSILTDERYFQGSLDYLEAVSAAVSLPCLRKDFIVHPFQLYEALNHGADAVLLIVAALDKQDLRELYAEAKALGLDVLVEVHNQAESDIALEIGCELIGINNRNLSDFTTTLSVTEELAPNIRPYATVVSESAIGTQADIQRVVNAGAQAVLIGTTFCASSDIGAKVKEVMGW